MPKLRRIPGQAGADEAGRGPLAGPVVAAAVILPRGVRLPGLDDSKKLDPGEREELAVQIRAKAIWAIAVAEPEEIDRLNILWASLEAMRRAVLDLREVPTAVWVDGNHRIPNLGLGCYTEVKGDGRIAEIAAASILAKTERDAIMRAYHETFPQYGFARHFGYPTPEHLAALRTHGPCPIHRRSFGPVQECLQACLEFD